MENSQSPKTMKSMDECPYCGGEMFWARNFGRCLECERNFEMVIGSEDAEESVVSKVFGELASAPALGMVDEEVDKRQKCPNCKAPMDWAPRRNGYICSKGCGTARPGYLPGPKGQNRKQRRLAARGTNEGRQPRRKLSQREKKAQRR